MNNTFEIWMVPVAGAIITALVLALTLWVTNGVRKPFPAVAWLAFLSIANSVWIIAGGVFLVIYYALHSNWLAAGLTVMIGVLVYILNFLLLFFSYAELNNY